MNEHQARLLHEMIEALAKASDGRIALSELVDVLEGAFHAAEFRDQELMSRFWNLLTPLETEVAYSREYGEPPDPERVRAAIEEFRASLRTTQAQHTREP